MIRYHRSINYKLCRLGILAVVSNESTSTVQEIKVFGLQEEYGHKAKFKEIDGRAPPGVDPAD